MERLCGERDFDLLTLHAPAGGLRIRAWPRGIVYAIEHEKIQINQALAGPLAGGLLRVYARVHDTEGAIRAVPVVGPGSRCDFTADRQRLVWSGQTPGLRMRCTARIHPDGGGWSFHLRLTNTSDAPVRCDTILLQDLGLAVRGHVRNNELFASHYLDHKALRHANVGHVLMTRQNLPQEGRHPWLLQACLPSAAGFVTDAMDFFGPGVRGGDDPVALSRPVIGQRVRAGELACSGLQGVSTNITPGGTTDWTFVHLYQPDHPQPSGEDDLRRLDEALQRIDRQDEEHPLPAARESPPAVSHREATKAHTPAGWASIEGADLSNRELSRLFPDRRHDETIDGRAMSFFHGQPSRHVALRAKELTSARPHGHILRAGRGLAPGDELLCCTCFAAGVLASQLAVGNSSLARIFSGPRDPLNASRGGGLRALVRLAPDEPWRMLGVPSAFEMDLDEVRWLYKTSQCTLDVRLRASQSDPAMVLSFESSERDLEVLLLGEVSAGPMEFDTSPRVRWDRAGGRIEIRPDPDSLLGRQQPELAFYMVSPTVETIDAIGGAELLLTDQDTARRWPYVAIRTRPTRRFECALIGSFRGDESVCSRYPSGAGSKPGSAASKGEGDFWSGITAGVRVASSPAAAVISDTLTWFARDAVVHLATPRGLEQPNGGAWGVRDVCQGAVEFLISYGHREPVADILRKVFSAQDHRRGDWPQWFMFPPYQAIRSGERHGDVVVWPVKALCDYLEDSDDGSILQTELPYTDESGASTAWREPLVRHVDRALDAMGRQFIPGTSLPCYGEGDWDDSLQPADPQMRHRMVSAWTTQLMYQTLVRWGAAMRRFGDDARATVADSLAERILFDFHRHLVPDGVVAGFALFERGQALEYLLHPRDRRTGLKYRLIPMTRGILSGVFSSEQALRHLRLIEQHLLFPDGARLMDRPTPYDGGIERVFRRSESAAYFGREIGLQYVHAHLRYAEALAALGRADELWRALRVVNPITVTEIVPNARPRQRNAYFSSSDAAFADRYEATRDYPLLRDGKVPVEGGWRVYSSGPGIYTSVVIRRLLGLRRCYDRVEFDPVLPRDLDGISLELSPPAGAGHGPVRYEFRATGAASVRSVHVNGETLQLEPAPGVYRSGGVRIPRATFERSLRGGNNTVRIEC